MTFLFEDQITIKIYTKCRDNKPCKLSNRKIIRDYVKSTHAL